MVGIDLDKFPEFSTCLEFVEGLGTEQSVLAFPGTCFDFPGYFRFVLTIPEHLIQEACQRIQDFCYEHYKEGKNSIYDGTYQCSGKNTENDDSNRFIGTGVVVTSRVI